MATTINASTSSGLLVTPDTSGIIQLQSNGTTIMTVGPTGVSTQVGAPAFSAYPSVTQTGISNNVWTKVTFDTKEFDTNTNFSSSRFTPTVAGYYQLNTVLGFDAVTINPTWAGASIYKNGAVYKQVRVTGMTYTLVSASVSTIVYANGTTDYFEVYAYFNGATGGQLDAGNTYSTYFNGAMVRSA
jgi:hypothetical protein